MTTKYFDMGRDTRTKERQARGWFISTKQAMSIVNIRGTRWWVGEAADQSGTLGWSAFCLDDEDGVGFLPMPRLVWPTPEDARASAQAFFATQPRPFNVAHVEIKPPGTSP